MLILYINYIVSYILAERNKIFILLRSLAPMKSLAVARQ